VYRTVLAADLPPGIVDSLLDDAPYSILAALSQHGFEAIVIVPIENQCHVDLLADALCDVQVQLFAGPRLGRLCRRLIRGKSRPTTANVMRLPVVGCGA
jgi:hypothetical protein